MGNDRQNLYLCSTFQDWGERQNYTLQYISWVGNDWQNYTLQYIPRMERATCIAQVRKVDDIYSKAKMEHKTFIAKQSKVRKVDDIYDIWDKIRTTAHLWLGKYWKTLHSLFKTIMYCAWQQGVYHTLYNILYYIFYIFYELWFNYQTQTYILYGILIIIQTFFRGIMRGVIIPLF